MNSALTELFSKAKGENRAALIGYIPAGFPSKEDAILAIKAMVAGGVDAIEVGFPYSDPVMDGPIIQAAAERSLANGIKSVDVFDTLEAVVSAGAVGLVMTYWNPIERYGVAEFAAEFARRGGSGLITPDLTVDESASWIKATTLQNLDRIYVVAPSTSDERLAAVTAACSGFVYAASLMGVTGTRTQVATSAADLVRRVRRISQLPVAVGLGVSTPVQAAEVAAYADGVIVGSAFIKLLQESGSIEEGCYRVEKLATELATACKR